MKPAEIEWIDDRPFSKQFGDIYFSKEGGLDESRYVFLQHNALPEKWRNKSAFTLIETGFGTGLNFLATWQAWQKAAPKNGRLHYIAVEQFPLKKEDMEKALKAYPELKDLARNLLCSYPPLVEGFYPVELNDPSVSLTLLWGDANMLLPQLVAKADAWYLDGFAPKKNPELWHDKIFSSIANLSKPGTSFATFTAAASVRKGLEQAGFTVQKTKGFGQKREMLYGRFEGETYETLPAWFALPQTKICHGKIAVIGGGIAGIACAYRLIKRGYHVDLYEARPELAAEASSNPKALLKPQLSPNFNLADQFYTEGFFYSAQMIQHLDFPIEAELKGLIQLAGNEGLAGRFEKIREKRELPPEFAEYVDEKKASQLAGIALKKGGFYFPKAGTVNLQNLCQALVKACSHRLRVHTNANINKLEHAEAWKLYDAADQLIGQADILVIANASAAKSLQVCEDFPLSPLPGQLSLVPANSKSRDLKLALSYEGHIVPAKNGRHFIGTTYRHGRENDLSESARDHHLVESYLNKIAPSLALNFTEAKAWVGCRSVTPDHLPLVGPVADKTEFDCDYQKIAQGNIRKLPLARYLPNLYISAGHGSKGLSSALLSAELIACLIGSESLPISAKLYQAVHPSRFWLRQLKKGRAV